MTYRIIQAATPASLGAPEAWAFLGAVAAERVAEAATWGYPELSDGPSEAWAWARNQRYERRVRFVAVHDGEGRPGGDGPGEPRRVLGSAYLRLPDQDNTHLAEVVVRVDPAWRGRGIGTALADRAEERIRGEGRRLGVTWTDHAEEPPEPGPEEGTASDVVRPATGSGRLPVDAATRFARAHGYVLEQAERHSVLDLPLADDRTADLWPQAEAGAGADYRVVTWLDEVPEQWLDSSAVLRTRMSTDVPLAGLDVEEDAWDGERVRDLERTQRAAGLHTLVAAAEHTPTGRLAAFTELIVRPDEDSTRPPAVFQDSTLALREHRGHRLGLLVKLANVRALTLAFPTAQRIHTWNAEENEHMLAINVAMGFRPAGISGTWQKHLT